MMKNQINKKWKIVGALVAMGVITLILMSVLYVMVIGFGGSADYSPAPYPYPSPPQIPPNDSTYISMDETLPEIIHSGEYVDTEKEPISTFGADVDTGSYVYARNSINYGNLPEADTVRTEEFLNYFDYNYPEEQDSDFSVYTECGPSYFSDEHYMLKIGIKAKSLSSEERPPMTIISVIDMSGSMASPGKLDLIKETLPYLVNQLQEGDKFGIVVYESTARDYLKPLGVEDKDKLISAIEDLTPAGSTNAQDGLIKGYEMALEHRNRGEPCRLLLLSDGVANTGVYDVNGLVEMVQNYKDQGIYLSTYGFGMGDYNDELMEQLADNGDGKYAYIDTESEARREFVQDLTGNMITVAKDLKLKVEFDPDVVEEYRLLGYENRVMTEEEFEDESKDSGDIGAGHTVTALYELKFRSGKGDIGSLEMRYKDPESGFSSRKVVQIRSRCISSDLDETSPQFRFALCVAEFAEYLKGSEYCDSTLWEIRELGVEALDEYSYKTQWEQEFIELLEKAGS